LLNLLINLSIKTMKKLTSKALELGATEMLTRAQMKNVVGGAVHPEDAYCGGSGSSCGGVCIEKGMSCGTEPDTGSCMCDYYGGGIE
jgi:hypothetical protein